MIPTRIKMILGRLSALELREVSSWAYQRARKKDGYLTPRQSRARRREAWIMGKGQFDESLTEEAKGIARDMGVSETAIRKIWVVRTGRLSRFLGKCYPRSFVNLIQINAHRTPGEIRDTLIHEVAHLLPSGSRTRWHTKKFSERITKQKAKEGIAAAMAMFAPP